MELVHVAHDIARVAPPDYMRGSNCYVLGNADLVLVEPFCHDEGRWWLSLARRWVSEGRRIAGIVLTHWHTDHLVGLGALATQLPGAPLTVWAPSSKFATRKYQTIVDGDKIHGWTVHHTPGHSDEHIVLERDGVVIGGDLITEGVALEALADRAPTLHFGDGVGAVVFDERAYRASYERVAAMRPRLVLPAHGDPLHEMPVMP